MAFILRISATFVIAIKRIVSQPGLSLAMVIGLAIAVTLMTSIPTYADAIYSRMFLTNVLKEDPTEDADMRPPLSLMFYYGGGLSDPIQYEAIHPADNYLTHSAGADMSLSQREYVRHLRTEAFLLFPSDASNFEDDASALDFVRFGYVSDIEHHVEILEGEMPAPADPRADVVDVMMSEAFVNELGLQIGEEYLVYIRDKTPDGLQISTQIPVRVAGVWKPIDIRNEFWFIQPHHLENQLLISEEVFAQRISPFLDDEVYAAVWYLVLNEDEVHYSIASDIIDRIDVVEKNTRDLLPDTRLAISPRSPLQDYRDSAVLLTILLYAFAAPIIGLLLAFIGLTASLSVEQRRNEIAVLRSRGASRIQLTGIALIEGLILGGIALALGSIFGLGVARLIGQTRSFLDFQGVFDLSVRMTMPTLQIGVGAVGIAILAQLIPTFVASGRTIVMYKQERARMLRHPWWQRAYVDFLLLIPAFYGIYLMQDQGSVGLLNLESEELFINPLFFLIPSLTMFTFTLLVIRLIPRFLSLVSWLVSQSSNVSLLMAARHLARSPSFYTTPLILLILTLALSTFTASLAHTLDEHLFDQVFYRVGTDTSFYDFGEAIELLSEEETQTEWRFLPVSDYLQVPGVQGATRVGDYRGRSQLSGGFQTGKFLGVDRFSFGGVSYWRKDFADENLGTLMNRLAVNPAGVLVNKDYLEHNELEIDSPLRITVTILGQRMDLDFRVVGTFDLFPTWYPEDDGPLFVGNLDYLFTNLGGQVPYDVWLRHDSGIGAEEVGVSIVGWNTGEPQILKQQQQPERQGLFGLLSVGFAAAAVITVLGFLLYIIFSFQRRMIEMGVLRAIGLSTNRMALILMWELIFLIGLGGVIGAALGTIISQMFIPFLQIGNETIGNFPPFIVRIAWSDMNTIFALFGSLFIVALILLTGLLLQIKIFQAIKLGETI